MAEKKNTAPGGWVCSCGADNDGDFLYCRVCGRRRPKKISRKRRKKRLIKTALFAMFGLCLVFAASVVYSSLIGPFLTGSGKAGKDSELLPGIWLEESALAGDADVLSADGIRILQFDENGLLTDGRAYSRDGVYEYELTEYDYAVTKDGLETSLEGQRTVYDYTLSGGTLSFGGSSFRRTEGLSAVFILREYVDSMNAWDAPAKLPDESVSGNTVRCTASGEKMPGSEAQIYTLETPLSGCVGFTLVYNVPALYSGSCNGLHNLYIFDGRIWTLCGTFDYSGYGETRCRTELAEGAEIYAAAVEMVAKTQPNALEELEFTDIWLTK